MRLTKPLPEDTTEILARTCPGKARMVTLKTPPLHITSTRDGRYKAVYIYDEIKCQLQQIILRYVNKWAWLTVRDKETHKNINT